MSLSGDASPDSRFVDTLERMGTIIAEIVDQLTKDRELAKRIGDAVLNCDERLTRIEQARREAAQRIGEEQAAAHEEEQRYRNSVRSQISEVHRDFRETMTQMQDRVQAISQLHSDLRETITGMQDRLEALEAAHRQQESHTE